MGKYGYTSNMKPAEKLMVAIVRISELYKKSCSSIFLNYGLTFSQYTVLRVLQGSKNGQNTISKVSKVMLVSGPNMTGVAKRLENNGFIIRKSDPNDERVKILEITPRGRQALENIESEKDYLIKNYLNDFTDDNISELLTTLKKCLNQAKFQNET